MKKILIGLTLLTSLSSFANIAEDRCMVNIDYSFGIESVAGIDYVGSSSGPVKGMSVDEIQGLLKVALNENGYYISKTSESRDYVLKFNFFNNLNDAGTTFGGIDLNLNGPSSTVGVRQTPGIFDQLFKSEKKQVRNTTKSAIATMKKILPRCL